MKNKILAVSLSSLILLLSVGLLFLLAGCAAQLPDRVPVNSRRNIVWFLPVIEAQGAFAPATLNPAAVTPPADLAQTLPEAGDSHPAVTASAPGAPTPTLQPVKPTATPTEMPIQNSPTPEQRFKPDAPTRLIIPAIGLDAPVVTMGWSVVEEDGQQVSEWDVPSWRAAGWLNTSALVGQVGNTVIVGHQNIDGRVFEDLEYLKKGDEVQMQAGSALRHYVIVVRTIVPEKDQPLEVRRENARWIAQSNDERLTLVTCWPRNDNTHRLILVALPAP